MTHLPPAMCSTCLRLLGEQVHGGEISYGHPADDGHVPTPVPVDYIRAIIHCDFCRDEVQLSTCSTVPCEDYTVAVLFPDGRSLTNNFRGDWCTCPTCAGLIRNDEWEALIDRVLTSMDSTRSEEHLVAFLTESYKGLIANATGPIRPYEVGDGPLGV